VYANQGYLSDTRVPFKDTSKPLVVASCGVYRLHSFSRLPTRRPRGRPDYQLLYVAAGKAHFFFDGTDRIVSAGQMVLYLPRQEQHYTYFGDDKPEVYWIHFTGSNVKNILRRYQIPLEEPVFTCGVSSGYSQLFKSIILELQTRQAGYQELCEMYLQQLFLLVQRSRLAPPPTPGSRLQEEIQAVCRWFNEHYNEEIVIEQVARQQNMSVAWFQRSFKQLTGQTPMQYILALRIRNAIGLLESTDSNITEIAAIVGYDNPLYFSRLFRKQTGVSPTQYRKLVQQHTDPFAVR